MRASVVSRRSRVTRTSSAPRPLMVPANTSSPGRLVHRQRFARDGRLIDRTGAGEHDSRRAALLARLDDDDRAGPRPGRQATFWCLSSVDDSASAGVRSSSARTAVRARSSVRASSAWATANRKTTAAASDHSPRAIAPAAATSISTLMSSDRARTACQALRAVSGTPAAMATANSSRDTSRRVQELGEVAGGRGSARRDEQRRCACGRPTRRTRSAPRARARRASRRRRRRRRSPRPRASPRRT